MTPPPPPGPWASGPEAAVPGRLGAVRERMAAAGIDAVVLRPSPDFRFLGGRGGGFLVVTADAAVETADPRSCLPPGVRRVGVDPEMRVRELFGLAVEAELVPAAQVFAPLRLRKEPYEVALVERAALAAESVLGQARELSWFGATERAMATRLRVLALESGCEEVLSARVAAGPGTAEPGSAPSGRVINPGDALVVSLSGRWDGYCAEVARVYAVAEPPEDFDAVYSVLVAAHHAGMAAARHPATASAVASAVAQAIDDSGYGRYAAPAAGRGVGLGADEAPRLRADDDTPLEPGTVFCLEPAIYVPDLFGARLGDMVTCTDAGPHPLTAAPSVLPVLER
ncbi:M24 family metallopeptidase [Nonomuraea sp. MCN248]|uniref:M24 family metallopeptidase n=1 Tax=Nonomuraea corallina TaxID=2989783 RepID=A0ABT4SBE7_9ACTN|nr:M24 family metallopeptidase [Nonomuraea corallina]MDA0634504.1 M24 family metallopeptidase [Nonomuraea corallina]